jgi:hypothetical protein
MGITRSEGTIGLIRHNATLLDFGDFWIGQHCHTRVRDARVRNSYDAGVTSSDKVRSQLSGGIGPGYARDSRLTTFNAVQSSGIRRQSSPKRDLAETLLTRDVRLKVLNGERQLNSCDQLLSYFGEMRLLNSDDTRTFDADETRLETAGDAQFLGFCGAGMECRGDARRPDHRDAKRPTSVYSKLLGGEVHIALAVSVSSLPLMAYVDFVLELEWQLGSRRIARAQTVQAIAARFPALVSAGSDVQATGSAENPRNPMCSGALSQFAGVARGIDGAGPRSRHGISVVRISVAAGAGASVGICGRLRADWPRGSPSS